MKNAVIEEILCKRALINDVVTKNRLLTPGTMNIAEIMNRHHLENQHSNILAFLLDPMEKHHHPEFGKEFLSLLRKKGLNVMGASIISVKREEATDEARRMDIFIETESDVIILENKIKAEDQFQQLSDYIKFVNKNFSVVNNLLVIYLTPYGKEPSEISIPRTELLVLKNDNKFINLSYENDILEWLNRLNTRDSEMELTSGLVQYKDVVKGLTNQRKEVFNMNQELALEYYKQYGSLSRDEIRKRTLAAQEFMNYINLTLFINLFKDIYSEGAEKGVKLLCNGRYDYNDSAEWEKNILNSQKDFGVRCEFQGFYRDLYVQNINDSGIIYASTKKEDLSQFGDVLENTNYATSVQLNSWFLQALRDEGKQKNWEDKVKHKLSYHILSSWWGVI